MPQKIKQTEHAKCHIKDKISWYEIKSIQENVCVKDLPLTKFDDGKYYCLFHLPTKNKDTVKFEHLFNERLANTRKQISELNLLPEDERKKELMQKNYQFTGIWFPTKVDLKGVKFEAPVNFQYATFSEMADFRGVVFESLADFSKSTFAKTSEFQFVKFFSVARFWSATFAPFVSFNDSLFESSVEFRWAKFNGDALFGNVKFSKFADFTEAVFLKYALFSFAKFEENSEVFFIETQFHNKILFNHTSFKGYITFEGKKENPVFIGKNVLLDLQKARFDDGKKVLFHTTRLQPNWFVNINATEFTFTDCKWKNDNNEKLNAKSEIEKLKKRWGVLGELIPENPYPILSEACWRLAGNAENNNRFEEALNFRRLAFETEWLEKKEKISNWIKNLVPESEKLKRRFGGSTDEEDKPIPPTNSFGILRRSGDFFIHGLYRITSFYGESWSWALGVLLSLILVVFPIIYTQINFQTCSKDRPIAASLTVCESKDEEIRKNCTCSTNQITFSDAIVQSLTTATLQNVEYRKPLTVWGEVWIILEKIFAPLQAALLALAIRRKFMR